MAVEIVDVGSRTRYRASGLRTLRKSPTPGTSPPKAARVGWVEAIAETHHPKRQGFDGFRCALPIHALTDVTDAFGGNLHYTLDAVGHRIREDIREAGGTVVKTHRRVYDALARLAEDIGAYNQTTRYQYDPNGNLTGITDPLNQITGQTYDALNRLIRATDPASGITQYTYDSQDRRTGVTDPKGLVTAYAYDGLGNRLQTDSPDMGSSTAVHDAAGNTVSETDARGITVTYRYDALNRLTAVDYPGVAEDIAYTYDEGPYGIGRRSGMQDAGGATVYRYDIRGNLVEQTVTANGISASTAYGYDAAGQLIRITYPSGRVVDYLRDGLGRIGGVTTTLAGETQTLASGLSYAPFGPLTGLTFGNGLGLSRTFDSDYRLTAQSVPGAQALSYTPDEGHRITAIADLLDPGRSQSFAYDSLDRLTQVDGPYGTLTYTYDAVGNRLTQVLNGVTDTYGYPLDSHRLEMVSGAAARTFSYDANGNTLADGAQDFTFGENNRLQAVSTASTPTAQYAYNGQGERVQKTAGGQTTRYHYGPSGELLAETDDAGTTQREYIYVDSLPLALLTVPPPDPAEQVRDNATAGAFTVTGSWNTANHASAIGGDYRRRAGGNNGYTATWTIPLTQSASYQVYAYWRAQNNNSTAATYTIHHSSGAANVSVNQRLNGDTWNLLGTFTLAPGAEVVLTQAASGHVNADAIKVVRVGNNAPVQTYYYHTDHLGTPQLMTDASQAVVWKVDYDPFGEATITTEAVTNNLRFPGQYFDAETGLHYNYFRDYDPTLGRYIESDPIGLAGGVNTYAYVGSNPVTRIDPLGLHDLGPIIGGTIENILDWIDPPPPAANDDDFEKLLPSDDPDKPCECDLLYNFIIVEEIRIREDERGAPAGANEIAYYQKIKDRKRSWNKLVDEYNRKCPKKIGRRFADV